MNHNPHSQHPHSQHPHLHPQHPHLHPQHPHSHSHMGHMSHPHSHSHMHGGATPLPGLAHQQHQHSLSADNVSWSTPSGTPSPPPPPPLPPHTSARWARSVPTPQPGDGCAQCRGRYAAANSRTTSVNSYSAGCNKAEPTTFDPSGPVRPQYTTNNQPPYIVYPTGNNDRCNTPLPSTPLPTPSQPLLTPCDNDDDSTCPVLLAGELRSLHRNIPALRRRDVDNAALRQHHYPEGGWGWIVCGAAFLAHLLTTGLQLAFGLLYFYTMQHLVPRNVDRDAYAMGTAWLGALCLCVSFLSAPVVIAVCRRKSTRLAAVFGGLVMALALLFTSFAVQFHQAVLSYGIVLGIGCGMVRETSSLVLGHYFKRRREFVEMVAQAGSGVGVALFSVLYKEAVGKLGWRLGLQAVTGVLAIGFFIGIVYRSASLYHPQRRAIMHLKNQRKKVKEKKGSRVKKPPLFDFSPLKSRALRVLMMACSTAALGLYTPVFYLAIQGYKEGLEDSALVLLQTFLGFALALGCVGFGLVTVRPSTQCLISRQYLCQAAMAGIGISLLALSAVQGYHGYVLFVWLYGVCLGGFSYSLKMLTLERLRARHFTRAWGWVRGAESIPVLLGVPITGYINQAHPKAGYYFSFVATVLGAALFFLVGQPKKHPNSDNNPTSNGNLPLNPTECACPVIASPYLNPYGLYRQGSHQYERVFFNCNDWDRGSLHRHSYRRRDPTPPFLPKSVSYAANMDRHGMTSGPSVRLTQPLSGAAITDKGNSSWVVQREPAGCITRDADFLKYSPHFRPPPQRHALRPSKSVPEGLARWDYTWGSYRRPRRPVQVIEQITTSV